MVSIALLVWVISMASLLLLHLISRSGTSEPSILNAPDSALGLVSNQPFSKFQQIFLANLNDEDIEARRQKGCGRFDRSSNPKGYVSCTLTCGRNLRSVCDRNRHEGKVYPQKYWACYLCMNINGPCKGSLFIRLDKLRDHNMKCHSGQLLVTLCEVKMTRLLFPRSCGLYSYRFQSQKDRSNHIATRHSSDRESESFINHKRQDGKGKNDHTGSEMTSPLHHTRSTHDGAPTHSVDACGLSWDGESFPIIPGPSPNNTSIVRFRLLVLTTTYGIPISESRLLAVQRTDEAQGSGAFGEVLKVKIALDDDWEHVSEPREFACK
jgi:hypothetical protein